MAGMIAEYDQMLVKDLAELKLFVVNQLVETVMHAKDQKTKVAALTKLGEVDGVDAFKKRSEVTVKVQPLEEVEKELFEIIGSLKSNTIDVDFKEV
jgi:ribosomal protein L17